MAPAAAKKLLRSILKDGSVAFTRHAQIELQKDNMKTTDVINVLRGGSITGPEWENGGWRYRAETQRFAVVFEFDSESECIVVTAWRFQ